MSFLYWSNGFSWKDTNPCSDKMGIILDTQRESKPQARVKALSLFPTGKVSLSSYTAFLYASYLKKQNLPFVLLDQRKLGQEGRQLQGMQNIRKYSMV